MSVSRGLVAGPKVLYVLWKIRFGRAPWRRCRPTSGQVPGRAARGHRAGPCGSMPTTRSPSPEEPPRARTERPPGAQRRHDGAEMVHVILTGRNAHPSIIEIADTVTEMKEVKHAYTKGIEAQRGIEIGRAHV